MPINWFKKTTLTLCVALAVYAQAVVAQDDDAMTPKQVIEATDVAIKLIRIGDLDEALDILQPINDITHNSETLTGLAKHYPNLGYAIYYAQKENWDETIRFATSVATRLDTDEFRNHIYRQTANLYYAIALQGLSKDREAVTVLRALVSHKKIDDLVRIPALFWLAKLSLVLDQEDKFENAKRYFTVELHSDDLTIPPLERVRFRYNYIRRINAENKVSDDVLEEYARGMITLVNDTPSLTEHQTQFYRGFAGVMLFNAGVRDEGMEMQWALYNYLIERKWVDLDLMNHALVMIKSLYQSQGPQSAYDFATDFTAKTEIKVTRVESFKFAQLQRSLAILSKQLKNKDRAQNHYRNAYALAREKRDKDDLYVLKIKKQIDPKSPGFEEFEFKAEIITSNIPLFELLPDTSTTLAAVYQGKYILARETLARASSIKKSDPALYYLNAAAIDAVLNELDDMETNLEQFSKFHRNDTPSQVPSESVMPHLIRLIAYTYISNHDEISAQSALLQLEQMKERLNPTELQLFLALKAAYHSNTDALIEHDAAISEWIEYTQTRDIENFLDLFSHIVALDFIFNAQPIEIDTALARTEKFLNENPQYTYANSVFLLLKDTLNPFDRFQTNALSELGSLQNAFESFLPAGHPSISRVRFELAEASLTNSNFKDALFWYGKTLDALYANKFDRDDTKSYIVSRQAFALWYMGRAQEAIQFARSAYDLALKNDNKRVGLFSTVLQTYVAILAHENNDYDQAIKILKFHIDDPEFFEKLPAYSQFGLIRDLANYMVNVAENTAVIAQYDIAERILENVNFDARRDFANIRLEKSKQHYWNKRLPEAFRDINVASEQFFAWRTDIINNGDVDPSNVDLNSAQTIVLFKAAIGWEYAQTLQ